MPTEPRAGRPKASSRENIAEAACELFLEQGYEQTSIVDIASRAGVSRSSFFNYFASKSDVLWSGLDERVGILEESLRDDASADAAAAVADRLRRAGEDALEADVAGAAHGGAVLAAIDAWAREGAGRAPLAGHLSRALTAATRTLPAP